MLLYLAGPMTGIPKFNYPAFEQATEELRESGYEVLSPHEADHPDVVSASWASKYGDPSDLPASYTMRGIIRRNVADVLQCDGLAYLPSWQKSAGAVMEEAIACRMLYPTDSVDGWLEQAEFLTNWHDA